MNTSISTVVKMAVVLTALALFTASTSMATIGCTPGYWKNHVESWGCGIDPTDTVDSLFVPNYTSGWTLLVALQGGGGSGAAGAEQILIRAAVAGMLNACAFPINPTDPFYPVDPALIVFFTNDAIQSGDRDYMLALAGLLDWNNNAIDGCPLN